MKKENIEEEPLELSEKMLLLAATNILSKDTYMFAKNNNMNFSNFYVFIETYKKGKKQFDEISKRMGFTKTAKDESSFLMLCLLEFGAGKCKLKNNENYIVIRKVLDYLVNNGHSQEQARDKISRMVESIYSTNNPYDEEITKTTNEGKKITFKKRQRYSRQYFYETIPGFINLVNYLPIELQEVISVVVFDDERNPWDIYWEKEYNIEDFCSAATSDYTQQKQNYYSPGWNAKINISMQTIVHEAGHAYDYHFAKDWGVETELISDSKLWKDAMQKDFELTQSYGVSTYSNESKASREDFAESISLYVTNPTKLNKFPNRKRLLDEKFKIERLYQSKKGNYRK